MSFFEELKRRNVVRVGIAYVVVCWLVAQVAELALDTFEAPGWVLKALLVFLALGLPVALVIAWAFEMTAEGVKREKDVDRSRSITPQTGRKLDRIIIAVLGVAVVVLLAKEFHDDSDSAAENDITATVGRQSIAVLPFTNMSDDKDYFADGLSEELLNLLAKSPELKVAGRTSAFAFKGRNEDLRQIGESLGVDHVLEGSVRRSGDRLRITAQLIKVDDGFHLWSETYDRQMADIFDIQDEVAGSIAQALRLRLSPDPDRPTDNTDAYALYLEALPLVTSGNDPHMIDLVIPLLDQALVLDPRFAKALELKALAYWAVSGDFIDSATARQRIFESASAALASDSSLVVARLLKTSVEHGESWLSEFRSVEAASARDPDNFAILRWHCFDLANTGYAREALACAERMIELEPLAFISHYRRGQGYVQLGQRDQARTSWRQAEELGRNMISWDIALEYFVAGDYQAAVETLDQWKSPDYAWSPSAARTVVEGVTNSENGKAFLDAWVHDALKDVSNFNDVNNVYFWYLAFGYIDDYWKAIHDLGGEKFYDWSDAGSLLQYGMYYPQSGFMRHPDFLEYAHGSRLTDLWDERGPPDRCSKESGEWVCE